jgi:hypothetical protein
MYGYNVHLREGRHHLHITKIKRKPKMKVVKEKNPKQEAFTVVREWISGGESSYCNSSD